MKNFNESHEEHKKRINAAIENFVRTRLLELDDTSALSKTLYTKLYDNIMAGGKRLRALAMIYGHLAFGGKDLEEITAMSVAPELFHTYTLIHDDVMDGDRTRRGKPTYWHDIYSEPPRSIDLPGTHGQDAQRQPYLDARYQLAANIAMSTGSMVLGEALRCLNDHGGDPKRVNEAIKRLIDANEWVNFGQNLDNLGAHARSPKESDYFLIAENKTGYLIGLSFELGAILAGAGPDERVSIYEMGKHLGVAFQLKDDLLDTRPMSETGKPKGTDIRQNKLTLLKLYTYSNADEAGHRVLDMAYDNPEATDEQIDAVVDLMEQTGAISRVSSQADKYTDKAKLYLKRLDIEKGSRNLIEGYIDFMTSRNM